MKIKFYSDDKLLVNKTTEIPSMVIVVRAIFIENNAYYPNFFLDECLYKLQTQKKQELLQKILFVKQKFSIFYLVFLLMTLALLIVVNIYVNLIKLYFTRLSKNKAKQKQKLITILRHKQ